MQTRAIATSTSGKGLLRRAYTKARGNPATATIPPMIRRDFLVKENRPERRSRRNMQSADTAHRKAKVKRSLGSSTEGGGRGFLVSRNSMSRIQGILSPGLLRHPEVASFSHMTSPATQIENMSSWA